MELLKQVLVKYFIQAQNVDLAHLCHNLDCVDRMNLQSASHHTSPIIIDTVNVIRHMVGVHIFQSFLSVQKDQLLQLFVVVSLKLMFSQQVVKQFGDGPGDRTSQIHQAEH